VYNLKIINKRDHAQRYTLTARGIDGLELRLDVPEIVVPEGGVLSLPARLLARESALAARSSPISFTLALADDPDTAVTTDAVFLGPQP